MQLIEVLEDGYKNVRHNLSYLRNTTTLKSKYEPFNILKQTGIR